MNWLKIFNTAAAGSLTILLTSCTNYKAPKTLFITFAVEQRNFKNEQKIARSILDKYTKAFQRSNPDIRIVYITYTADNLINHIAKDSDLHLGPDLVITNQYVAAELFERNLTEAPPNKEYLDKIYNPRIQSAAKINNKYTFTPWFIETQIACFNAKSIKQSPGTLQELEELSANGKKIGLSSDPYTLIWTAGSNGAIPEINSLSTRDQLDPTYSAIRKWLKWLEKAAIYQNIYFLNDARELSKKLGNNELDWVTCWGSQLEDLRSKMGEDLGVAALPNSTTSKALPTYGLYGFALGKNSSPLQRKMALKFIKTIMNTIAQRKLQLDDTGLLAANQNVSIPPESSRKLAAIDTSFNKQNKHYSKEWPGVKRWLLPEENDLQKSWERYLQLKSTLTELTDGYLDINEAIKIVTTTKGN